MKEILFRGKRLDNGEWVYGDLLTKDKNGNYCPRIKNSESYPFSFQVDPTTVGQFTGLYDKNGNKIFEGDILKFYKAITYVTFSLGEFHAIDCNNTSYCIVQDYCEIIGNINDNPELLGE